MEFLAGNRIIGTDSEFKTTTSTVTLLWEWDNTNANWSENGNIAISNSKINYSIVRDGTSDITYYNLGTALDDTFVLRMEITVTGESSGSGSNIIGFFGLSSSTGGSSTSQDFLGFYKAANDTNCRVVKDGATLAQTGGNGNRHTSGTKYYELKRTSSTKATFTAYNNSDYTSIFDQMLDITIPSTLTGLQYFKICNFQSGNGSGTVTGTVNEISVWNETSTPVSPVSNTTYNITNVPDGSIFYAKDTNKEYILYNNVWTEV